LLGKLDELEAELVKALGMTTETQGSSLAVADDPVASRLIALIGDRVGEPPSDEAGLIQQGLERFQRKQPPGFKDGPKKVDQLPERGTGDYLIWEQTLHHLEDVGIDGPFVVVTADEKDDWRLKLDNDVLGAHPELVAEARLRLGQPVYVISPTEFYDEATRWQKEADPDVVDSLISGADTEVALDWRSSTFEELLRRLDEEGYNVQAEAIRLAAGNPDGFVTRAEVYILGGFDVTRSLRRFSLPARRITLNMVDEGILVETAQAPLSAVYDGPGQATGFLVPKVFVEIVSASRERTWLRAAAEVAAEERGRWWSVGDLVSEIRGRNLKDLSRALTPEATLRRDLNARQVDLFESDGQGLWRLMSPDHGDE